MPNFTPGEPYLTKQEAVRVNQIDEWQLLYDNSYDDLTLLVTSPDQVKKEGDDWWLQLGAALPGLISKVSGDFLFGEPPIVEGKDDANKEFIENYFSDVFIQFLYEAAITQSSDGGLILKVFTIQDPTDPAKIIPRIQIISQRCYFPEFARHTKEILAVDLLTTEHKDRDTDWLLREHHEPGTILFEEYIIKKGTGVIISLESRREETTELDIIPIKYLPNFRKLGEFWGRSDYAGIEGIFVAINRRLTQNDHNLKFHGAPKLMGPGQGGGILGKDGQPIKKGVALDYLALKSSQVGAKSAEYKYLQQQLSTKEDLETIRENLKFVFLLSDVSPDVFGLGEGAAESGRALRLRLERTLTMIRRKAKLWKISLNWALDLALFLLGVDPNYTMTFQDGLATDLDELIDQQIQLVNNGLTTQKDALKAVHGYDDKTADEKLEIIRQDSVSKNEALNAGISI